METIVVTGGEGFIGSHLIDKLVAHYRVVSIDNGVSGNHRNPAAEYVRADIRDFSLLCEIISGAKGVFHLAAIARTVWCIDDPILCYATNVLGSVNVLEASRINNVRRVVLTSSNIVYAADTPYKASKLAMESAANVYHSLYGLSTVCIRNSNVYGPRQREDGIGPNCFAALRRSLRERGYVEITGDGEQTRDFTHVSDIVDAHLLSMQTAFTGVIDACSGRNVSLNYIAKLLRAPVRYVADRRGDVKHIIQDNTECKRLLGWTPKIALETGLRDVFGKLPTTNIT